MRAGTRTGDGITMKETVMELLNNIADEICEDTAIKALEEIKQYRENGYTIDRVLTVDCDYTALIYTLEDYGIESSEQLYEVLERQQPKQPNIWGDGNDDEGNVLYDMYDCPNCGKSYEIDYHDYKHCPECGQAIDRTDLERG